MMPKKPFLKDDRFKQFYEKIENKRVYKKLNKNPNEIMESISEPVDDPNLYIRLKSYIIILRRDKDHEVFEQFRTIVKTNWPVLCRRLNSRWLISIVDTFIDCGNEIDKRDALVISSIMTWEKMVHSDGECKLNKLWDGLQSVHKTKGDAHYNLSLRIKSILQNNEIFLNIFKTLIERGLADNKFTLSKMKNKQKFLSNLY